MTELDIAICIARIFDSVEDLHRKGLPDARGSRVRREAIHFLWETRELGKLDHRRPHSVAARAYRGSGLTELLRYEHSVPLATYMPQLRATARDPGAFLETLQRFVRPVIVLKSECDRLTAAGLASRMPMGIQADDFMARYRAAGVEIEKAP